MNNFSVRLKMLLFTLTLCILSLVGAGFMIHSSLLRYHAATAHEQIKQGFVRLDQELARSEEELRNKAQVLVNQEGLQASLSLITQYQDRSNYNAILFDTEKQKLSQRFFNALQTGRVSEAFLYDANGELVSFVIINPDSMDRSDLISGWIHYDQQGQAELHSEQFNSDVTLLDKTYPQPELTQTPQKQPLSLHFDHKGIRMEYHQPVSLSRSSGDLNLGLLVLSRHLDKNLLEILAGSSLTFALSEQERQLFASAPLRGEELKQAKHDGYPYAGVRFYSNSLGFLGVRSVENSPIDVNFFYPISLFQEAAEQTRSAIILAIVFAFILVIPASLWLLQSILTRPLQQLLQGAEHFARGNYNQLVAIKKHDELGRLGEAMNQMATEIQLREAELRISAIVFESQVGMLISDVNSNILRANQAFCDISGYKLEQLVGQPVAMLESELNADALYQSITETLAEKDTWSGEIIYIRRGGSTYPAWLTITAIRDEANQVTHFASTLFDITAKKQAEEEIQSLAYYDQLTHLPNRRLMYDRLQQAMSASGRSGEVCALLFIDLDEFKLLNDTQGHDIGDELLVEVSSRLSRNVRESDTVARLGGDEFLIILERLNPLPELAATEVDRVALKLMAQLREPFQLRTLTYQINCSMGITLFSGTQAGVDELIQRADLAMYQAKAAGKNTLKFFEPEMQTALHQRKQLIDQLHLAITEQQFVLYYQVQVNHQRRVVGAEALLRWPHVEQGMIPPDSFIPVAEETGLIVPLGNWVLQQACVQLKEWAANPLLCQLSLAVNISQRQLAQKDFVEQVFAALDATGANPNYLKLELTESILASDLVSTRQKMQRLRERGISFSLDDFGTGYSSLSYLKTLPLQQLKIDRSFIQDLLIDANDASIAQTIINLSSSLELSVIAEGVETIEQQRVLANMGCLHYQGYLFGRPLACSDFKELVISLEREAANRLEHAPAQPAID